jgi:hypothetical protein
VGYEDHLEQADTGPRWGRRSSGLHHNAIAMAEFFNVLPPRYSISAANVVGSRLQESSSSQPRAAPPAARGFF